MGYYQWILQEAIFNQYKFGTPLPDALIATILTLEVLMILYIITSTCFLAAGLFKIKKEIKHNSEMKLNQKIMTLHITMIGMVLFVEVVVFSFASYYARRDNPTLFASLYIWLFISLDLIQVVIAFLFLKLATPSPKLMVKDSFVSSEEEEEPIKGYDVHYYARDGKLKVPIMVRKSEEIKQT